MPWHQGAMKEAEDCHKLRGAVYQALIRRCPNGGTLLGKTQEFSSEYIGWEGERHELKHLSSVRKRKQSDSLSSGERTGRSLNSCHVIACVRCGVGVVRFDVRSIQTSSCGYCFNRTVLERTAKEGDSPVREKTASIIFEFSSTMEHV
jgi:ribosomal protein L37E